MKNTNENERSKYVYIAFLCFLVFVAGVLFFFTIFKLDVLLNGLATFFSIISPFIIGFFIAFLLTPFFNFTQKKFKKLFTGKKPTEKNQKRAQFWSKFLAAFLSITLALIVIGGTVALIIPQVVTSITSIIQDLPSKATTAFNWLDSAFEKIPFIDVSFADVGKKLVDNITQWANVDTMGKITTIISSLGTGIATTFSFLYKALIALIVTIYMLIGKETFAAQSKKLLYSIFSPKFASATINEFKRAGKTFFGFFNGKIIDSLIIGILCFIGMTVLGIPYSMLVSVIVCITNIIPNFGPFIGAVPSALFILLEDPVKCLWFVIFILVLQQFDGNILGPRILASSLGISDFWVVFALVVFGGYFGFLGMLFGVPLFAVIYDIISRAVNKSIKKRGLSKLDFNKPIPYDPEEKKPEDN